jgi:UDP-N-acetylenolpyruvoylglucosamine reductase
MNMQPRLQAGSTSNFLFRDGQKSVYCTGKSGVIGAEAREPVSIGQICIWARICKWCEVLSLSGLHHSTRLSHLNSLPILRTYLVIRSGIV